MSGERERRVVVGVQDSGVGLQALRRGVEEARWRGGTLCLVRVVDCGAGRYAGGAMWSAELAVWAGEYGQQALIEAGRYPCGCGGTDRGAGGHGRTGAGGVR